jgi:uncharacterized protein YciI
MNRDLSSVDIGDHNTKRKRFFLVVQDDPSGPAQADIIRRQHDFLRMLVDTPQLLTCGPAFAERLTIYHDGERWTLRAEAEANVP